MGCGPATREVANKINKKSLDCISCGTTYQYACVKRQIMLSSSTHADERYRGLSFQDQLIEATKCCTIEKIRNPFQCAKCDEWIALMASPAMKELFLNRG